MSVAKVEIRRRPAMALFAVLAVGMVVGSYVFVLLLATACVYIPYLILTSAEFSPYIVALFVFGIIIAATMLWSLVPRRDQFTAPGLLLDRATQPKLFAELDGIAAALNETLPREVYLIGAPNAFVADRGGVMGFGSRRVMGLGLPLLSILTVSQFRAVLAHEFGHYYGGDTSLGPWVYKTKTSILRIFENIGSVGQLARIAVLGVMYLIVTWLLKGYFIAFMRAIHLVSRQQEYRADELACLVAGRQNLIDGLQAIHRAAAAWPVYWKNEVSSALKDGSLVALGDGFARFVSVPEISSQLEKSLHSRLQEEKTNPYNTHPALKDRIAAAEKLSEGSSLPENQPASTLMDDLPATELKLVQQCVEDVPPSLKYVSWDQIATTVTIPSWEKFVTEYSQPLKGLTVEMVPDQVPKLREIGSRIRDPKGMLLSPEQRTVRAGWLFASAIALAMIRDGWELEVQPGVCRMRRGERELNPFALVAELMQKKFSREAWVSKFQEAGLAQAPLLPGEASAPQPQPTKMQAELFPVEAGPPPSA